MKAKYIIGGIIVAVFIVWGGSAFLQSTVPYVSIDHARSAERVVQVMGKIDFDNVKYNSDDLRLEFAIYDAKAESIEGASTLDVVYYGVVPGNFDQAVSVVLKGQPRDGEWVADQMLVKCPSKYQGEGGDEYRDMKEHDEAVEETGV